MADHHQPNVVQYMPQQPHRGDDESQYLNQQISGPPNSRAKVVAVATLVPVGGILLGLSGLSLVATLIGVAIATPLFLLFSPVLVPAALVLSGSVAGFLASGAFGITGLSSFSWIVNYLRQAAAGQGARHSPTPTPTWQLQQQQVVNQGKRDDEQQQVDQAKREQQVDQGKRDQKQQPQQDTKDHSKSQEAGKTTTATPTPTPEAGKAKTHDATKK